MSPPRIRTLVVDDSAFARKVLREVLASAPDIEVVGIARDGLEALERIAELNPDVVTLDLAMPHLDGTGVLQALPRAGGPRVVVVSTSDAESERAIEAMQAGAVELVHKPTALATQQLFEVAAELVRAVRTAYVARVIPADTASTWVPPARRPANASRVELVVLGTSTGGPQALTQVISALPADFPVPLAVALHIPPGYTEALAKRLDEASRVEVVEASNGLALLPGRVVIARSGLHLRVRQGPQGLVCALDASPMEKPHRPSVDVLFESAAQALGDRVLGVVLTGMGDDGLLGSRALVARGARVLTEAEESCVVYGMPRTVTEAGLSHAQVPLPQIVEAILRLI